MPFRKALRKIKVRTACKDDLNRVNYLEKHSLKPSMVIPFYAIKEWFELFPTGFLVAEYKGKIVGYTAAIKISGLKDLKGHLEPKKIFSGKGNYYYIVALAILPKYWGRGIGSALLRQQAVIAAKNNCKKMGLVVSETRTQAIELYKNHGMKIAKEIKNFFKGKKELTTDLLMECDVKEFVDGMLFDTGFPGFITVRNKIIKDPIEIFMRIKLFLDFIDNKDRIAVVHHGDGDGLMSACVISHAIHKIRGKYPDLVMASGYQESDMLKRVIPKIKKLKANKVIVLDLSIDANPILLEKIPKIDFLIIDHHKIYRDLNDARTIFIKAQYVSDVEPSKYPAAKLTYDLLSSLMDIPKSGWYAAVGLLSDLSLEQWNEFIQKMCIKHKVTLDQLLKIKELISAVEAMAPHKFNALMKEFLEAKSPREVLSSPMMDYRHALKKEIRKWMDQVYRKAEFIPELNLIFYYIKTRHEIKSALINELSTKLFPSQTLIVIQDRGDNYLRISARRQDFREKMNELLEEAVKGLPKARGGGHVPAAAGRIRKKDLLAFKRKITKVLVKKHFKELKIKTAKVHEIDEIMKIEKRVFNPMVMESEKVYMSRLRGYPQGFFVASLAGKLIGFVCGERWLKPQKYDTNHMLTEFHNPEGKIFYISSLAVLPEFRNRGIGSLLIRTAIDFAEKEGCTKIVGSMAGGNDRAASTYKKIGFNLGKTEKPDKVMENGKQGKYIVVGLPLKH